MNRARETTAFFRGHDFPAAEHVTGNGARFGLVDDLRGWGVTLCDSERLVCRMIGGWLRLIADGSHRVGLDTSRTRLLFCLTVAHPARLAGSYEPMKLQMKPQLIDAPGAALDVHTATARSLNACHRDAQRVRRTPCRKLSWWG
jgi:hypothetical protein